MGKNYLPARESVLVSWTSNFATMTSADPAAYGLTLEQAAAYVATRDTFTAAYQLAQDPVTRSPANIEAKNTAKAALIAETRRLVKICQASPVMTDNKRAALGVTVPDVTPTPVPVPAEAPQLDVVSVTGRSVKLRLREASTGKRKKPEGVMGAAVFSYVGESIPADMRDWTFEGNDTRLDVTVDFAQSFAPATKVWLCAFWFNRRGESGSACTPVSTHLGFGVASDVGPDGQPAAA